ncbi:MurR/RpiR family transcriptional regulator [Culicoidibacter larvae]|uniref:MurR/RpiR family transcriptional regulator n=1 Tax=Culicoidibacter larvae TaxID=2579976 RepID=A0A5R8QFZ8_9FIRM|nr:MurR/RpiR family transcriptional regulator [Culicoidibacter larvae]TLG76686.1 MurR/RpiR family transcriptional regulator [Culicoidibacter larvae]
MSNILQPFIQYLPQLSESEKHVLYYLENLPSESYKSLSLTKLAEATNVSTTTVIRMCQKLNLSGFSELKFHLTHITPAADQQVITESILDSVHYLTAETAIAQYNQAAKMIQAAKRIFVIGVGLSKVNAEYFSKLLMQVGKESSYIYESHIAGLIAKR